jgi:hypothetical protein
MSNENWWVANEDNSEKKFPSWQGTVFRGRNREKLKETIKRIYALACEEELYRIVKKGKDSDDSEILSGVTKLDFHCITKEDHSYDNLDKNGLSWYNDCEEQCKVSYYALDGQIATEWIGCFHDFYVKLRSGNYVNLGTANFRPSVNSLPLEIDYGFNSDGFEMYEVSLCSDVWFPRVVGWLDSEEPFYDNSELSSLNTPRFNRFLQRTKELILNLGGKWELVGDRPVAIDDYELFENYYSYSFNPKMIDSKIIYVDGIEKEVYPSLSKYKGVENISPECQITENGISLEIDLKSRNRWCMLTDEKSEIDLPKWTAHFPAGKFVSHQDFWPFVKTILEVGQQEEIFRIFTEEAEFRRFIRDVDSGILPMPFLEVLHGGISGTKVEEQLVTDNLPEYIRNIQGMTKVSYYEKDGQLVDKYVEKQGLGKFLYNYHLGDLGEYQCEYRKRFLHAYYGCLEFYDRLVPEYDPEGCHLDIKLTSDIWFPTIDGSVERKVGIDTSFDADEIARYTKGFDNRELANRHTPRLNRFLSAIAEKVIEMGGEWSIGLYVDPKYLEKMTLTGIQMDV